MAFACAFCRGHPIEPTLCTERPGDVASAKIPDVANEPEFLTLSRQSSSERLRVLGFPSLTYSSSGKLALASDSAISGVC